MPMSLYPDSDPPALAHLSFIRPDNLSPKGLEYAANDDFVPGAMTHPAGFAWPLTMEGASLSGRYDVE